MRINYYTGKAINNDLFYQGGLYLVGSCHFNPYAEEEKFYWIKVGRTDNLHKRMHHYNTHNAMLFKADYLFEDDADKRKGLEKLFHYILEDFAFGKASSNSEWYEVPKAIYFEICENGFKWFKEKIEERIDFEDC